MAAAYAALVSLSQIIHQILNPPPTHQFSIPDQQIDSLQHEVTFFINFLDKLPTIRFREIQDLEKRIVDAAHKAEDIIESYVVSQIRAKYLKHQKIKSSAHCCPSMQNEIGEKVLKKKAMVGVIKKFLSMRKVVDKLRSREGVEEGRFENTTTVSSFSRSLPGGKNLMIGFDEHLNQVRAALVTYESRLQIMPIVGMGGIGKTTLATNVYNDAYIVQHFDFRAFVSVSQEYMERDIIVALLQQININIEVNEVSAYELGILLHKELFGRRYFIVLDDMWDTRAWDMLKLFFPDNSNGSRILVTTRLLNLAEDFNSCAPYQLGLLDDECSWDLLVERAFGKEGHPTELEEIGKSIARKCGGLPLALVVIGGLLAKSEKTKDFWEYVEENVTSTANDENNEQCMKILRLSYTHMPVYLKPCFLYLAVFPKNVEISMSKLIKLWVAEGFIRPASSKVLEEVAEGYLEDLFGRNLIIVKKRGLTGKMKNFIIHDLIRDLCMREVARDKFLCIAKLDNPIISTHAKKERRLCIHIDKVNEKASKVLRSATLSRSFLSYSKWESGKCINHRHNLLRVLDVVDLYSMDEILQLFNSRYITCCIPRELHVVSSLISLLWNLQTLVLPSSISLPSEIWQMPHLRHLKMPRITLPDPQDAQGESHSIVVLEHLQTLSTVNDFVFRKDVLRRIPNLKKLGIYCDEEGKMESNLASLQTLESLVLTFRGTWDNMAFPISLKKLSLSDCEIPWDDMSVVGSLPNLEVLKLQNRAAKGRTWNPIAGEFCRLKFLLIDQCEMGSWVAHDGHFPCLEHLRLVRMKMEEIPSEFAEIPTLQTIDLNYCSRSLFESAESISKERDALGYEEIQVRCFPPKASRLSRENVVGLEDEAEKIMGYLTENTEKLGVISIVGMAGIGKTTLAKKIFHDPHIQRKFPVRIWVHVSQEFTTQDILRTIIKEFDGKIVDIEDIEFTWSCFVDYVLEQKKFLLVMDDVWSCEDWNRLQRELPNKNNMGKILITSREAYIDEKLWSRESWELQTQYYRMQLKKKKKYYRMYPCHMMRFLTPEESCLLFQLEVFQKPEYPRELEAEVRLVAQRCKGLPLAIVVVGGILAKSFSASSEISSMKETCREVSDMLSTYLIYDTIACIELIISFSYRKLPYHMRKCFLYMGMFPQGFEIPTRRLIWLWIAEGLIQQNDDLSMEETAETYLEDLISTNLVRADKLKADGKVKTCRIHDLIRDFCITEAGNERANFFQEIKMLSDGEFQPPVSQELKCHRLCVHSNAISFFSKNPYSRSVTSFVYSSRYETAMPTEKISVIPAGFKQLRVVDISPIKLTKFPSDMFQLLHLTYIALSGNFDVLPAAFSKFGNIQTLIVDTVRPTLDVKVDILNMVQLRHFKTNASTTLPDISPTSNGGEKIQTLGRISPESCSEEVFFRAQNLKKLTVCGDLALLLEGNNRSFENLGNLVSLEKLNLINEGVLRGLPPAYKFPNKLRSLTLSSTLLHWMDMSVLGSLENLEVLKLKDNAFMGMTWKTSGVFPNLEVLHIDRTNLVVWLASYDQFPRLKCLQLRNCAHLMEIPVCLADISNFQVLDLYRSEGAAKSAKKIERKKKSGKLHEFKLNIH